MGAGFVVGLSVVGSGSLGVDWGFGVVGTGLVVTATSVVEAASVVC